MAPVGVELSASEILADLWKARWRYSLLWVAIVAAGGTVGHLLPRKYQATALVVPAAESGGGLPGAMSQYGGLLSLAGISVGGGANKDEAIATLQSDLLIGRFIRENNLLPRIFADAWDAQNNEWKGKDPAKAPTLWKGTVYFKSKVLRVNQDKKSGLISVGVVWTDPAVAADWANQLIKLTNGYLRNQAVAEAERNIGYLESQSEKPLPVDTRQALSALLKEQMNRRMIAGGKEDFALRAIDPAVAPEVSISLGTKKSMLLGAILGGFLVILIAAVRRIVRPATVQ